MMADFAEKFSVGRKFEELRCSGTVGGAGSVAELAATPVASPR